MKAKKVLALCVAAVMTMSLAACGGEDATNGSVEESTVESSSVVEESSSEEVPESSAAEETPAAEAGPASVDFEDGLYGFVGDNTTVIGGTAAGTYNVVDYNGSKALEAVPGGKPMAIGFQIDAMLGDKLADVKTVDLTIGVTSADGNFYACSGNLYGVYAGEKNNTAWSVYLDTANPKSVTYTVPDGKAFAAGDTFVVSLETDNAATEGVGYQTVYIDNLTFKDADGNVIEADSAAEFAVADTGMDPNLMVLKDTVELEGFACSGSGWSQGGWNPMTEEQIALIQENLVPGSVIEIEYSSDAPIWLVSDGQTGWHRAVDESTFEVCGYVAADGSKVQYTYEQLASFWGDGFEQNMTFLQGESSADYEIYSVKIGTDSGFVTLGSGVELEGFACSGSGWSQAGWNPMTEEQIALIAENLVPGSVMEIEYASDAPVWLVSDGQTGWHRAVDESTFEVCGAVADGKVQYTYEQLASFWGEGFEQNMTFLQCESSADFEIYSVKISSDVVQRAHDMVELEGFACSGSGWSQAGLNPLDSDNLTKITENLVPGSVINIEYASDAPVWLVSDGQTGWQRAVDESTFEVSGTVYKDGAAVQYTYEQLAAFWGEGFQQSMTFLQGESSADFEIYSVKIGQTN
ncbi:MAG: hypothetical protein J6B43_10805 [Lachnospiraceae bacterium]|nr:hypothetical protein [Lachnospiraceae bacterium]